LRNHGLIRQTMSFRPLSLAIWSRESLTFLELKPVVTCLEGKGSFRGGYALRET